MTTLGGYYVSSGNVGSGQDITDGPSYVNTGDRAIAFREALRELVRQTVDVKQMRNHMGKKAWRRLRRFCKATEIQDFPGAIDEAIKLGVDPKTIVGIAALMEFPLRLVHPLVVGNGKIEEG